MISDNKMKFVDQAANCAMTNKGNINSKHGAVLVKNGKIQAAAYNTETTHAEMECIKRGQAKGN